MRVIRASEIGEYVFCHRAWWLRRVQGYESANVQEMAAGTGVHAQHGRALWAASAMRVAAFMLIVIAVIWFILAR